MHGVKAAGWGQQPGPTCSRWKDRGACEEKKAWIPEGLGSSCEWVTTHAACPCTVQAKEVGTGGRNGQQAGAPASTRTPFCCPPRAALAPQGVSPRPPSPPLPLHTPPTHPTSTSIGLPSAASAKPSADSREGPRKGQPQPPAPLFLLPAPRPCPAACPAAVATRGAFLGADAAPRCCCLLSCSSVQRSLMRCAEPRDATGSCTQRPLRLARHSSDRRLPKGVRRSSPTNWASWLWVRLAKKTCTLLPAADGGGGVRSARSAAFRPPGAGKGRGRGGDHAQRVCARAPRQQVSSRLHVRTQSAVRKPRQGIAPCLAKDLTPPPPPPSVSSEEELPSPPPPAAPRVRRSPPAPVTPAGSGSKNSWSLPSPSSSRAGPATAAVPDVANAVAAAAVARAPLAAPCPVWAEALRAVRAARVHTGAHTHFAITGPPGPCTLTPRPSPHTLKKHTMANSACQMAIQGLRNLPLPCLTRTARPRRCGGPETHGAASTGARRSHAQGLRRWRRASQGRRRLHGIGCGCCACRSPSRKPE